MNIKNVKNGINNRIPFVLILNGTSSAGKSCISDILREKISAKNVLFLGIDDFVNMLPPYLVGETIKASSGFQFYLEGGGFNIKVGNLGNIVIRQMHNFAENLLRSGLNVIIDHVVLTKSWAHDLEGLSKTGAKIFYVLVTCDIKELKNREKIRGNRLVGLASGLKHVESNIEHYDLVVDTTFRSPKESVEMILQYLNFEGLN
jgi:chloramphenicol 3-O phosphotransferase